MERRSKQIPHEVPYRSGANVPEDQNTLSSNDWDRIGLPFLCVINAIPLIGYVIQGSWNPAEFCISILVTTGLLWCMITQWRQQRTKQCPKE